MNKIGIFFGTDSGTTRLMAKKIAQKLGPDLADKPLNVNRISAQDLLRYDVMILGTPTYGENQLPGEATGIKNGSWAEFLPQLAGIDLSDKTIALYGLGNQDKYRHCFADSLGLLYRQLKQQHAHIIGSWPGDGYSFEHSQALEDGRFIGLVLDQQNQSLLTEQRLDQWLHDITPAFKTRLQDPAAGVQSALPG